MNGEAEPPNVADGELEDVTLLENKLPSIDPLGTGLPNLSVENEINSSRLPPAAAVNAGVAVFGTKPPALPVKIVKSALAGTAAKLRTTRVIDMSDALYKWDMVICSFMVEVQTLEVEVQTLA